MIFAKGTLLVPSGTGHDPHRKHLFIICNDTDESGHNLIVPISTWTNDLCDGTCILLKHEHDWLTKPKSYVAYRHALVEEAAKLVRGINDGKVVVQAQCNAQVFLRVRNGVCKSPRTPRKIKNYFCDPKP